MPPKFTSRQLTYDAPPVPKFLQSLHRQVNQTRGDINDKRGDRQSASSEFDDLLGVGSSTSGQAQSNKEEGKTDKEADEEAEDWFGAQVVVLKEGKHLTKEEAAHSNETLNVTATEEVHMPIGRADAGPTNSTFKRRTTKEGDLEQKNVKGDKGMDEVKKLIASKNQTGEDGLQIDDEGQEKRKRKEDKEKRKEERNKRARVEKSKMGKGLSFSMDD